MATQRKIYRGGLVEGVAVPTVDFSQYKVMSSGWASLNQKIDGITNFAVKHLDVQMADEGTQYAAENPVSLEQFYKANPTDRENLLGGNKTTTFGKAIRATHISILSSDMSIKAQKDFMDLDWEAETLALKGTPMNLDLYKGRLDAIVNGYSDALLDVDAEASLVAKAKLATTANSYYTSYADTLITDYKKKTIAQAMWAGNAHINNRIKKIIALGSEVEIPGADGKPVKISIDDYLAAEKIRIGQELLNSNVSVEQLTKWAAAWDAEVVQQKKNWLFANYVDIDENYNKSVAHQQLIWDEVRKGTFSIEPQSVIYPPGADQETIAAIDAKAAKDASTQSKRFQAMYNSLSEKEQREFRGKVKAWAGNALDQAENEEKAITIDKAKTVEDLKFKYQISLDENNYEAAQAIVEELKTIDKETYIDLSKELKEDKDKGEFNDEGVYDALYEYLWSGTLTEEAINLTYDRGLINWDTKKDLKNKTIVI